MKKKILLLLLMTAFLMMLTACDSGDYKKAASLYDDGDYEAAAELYESLDDYEDSVELAEASRYAQAEDLLDDGDYDAAEDLYANLGDYEDSEDMVDECSYRKACDLMEQESYDEAVEIFEGLGNYSDAEEQLVEVKKEIMHRDYGDVVDLLQGESWYFNGGSDILLNEISFTDEGAVITQVSFDGNGRHDEGENTYEYLIDDENVSVILADGSELNIPYAVTGSELALGSGDYYTAEQVDEEIQGYWYYHYSEAILGMYSEGEYHICFDNGTMSMEYATLAYGSTTGEYYYYGPYEGTYSVESGEFDNDMEHGNQWFFNIIDGEVVILHYGDVCERDEGFPGEYGYSF